MPNQKATLQLEIKRLSLLKERLENLLAKLEATYKQLDYTSSLSDQENLKRQADAIEKQCRLVAEECETVEQTLQQQAQAQGLTLAALLADSSPTERSLLDLLQPYAESLSDLLRAAYQSACPNDWRGPRPADLSDMVATLETMVLDAQGDLPVLKFAAHLLASETLPAPLPPLLQTWAEQQNPQFDQVVQRARQAVVAAGLATLAEPHLMVLVRRSNQQSSNPQQFQDQYFVDAWMVPNVATYRAESGEGCHALTVEHDTYAIAQLPELIGTLLDQCENYSTSRPVIEIFLPLEQLNEPVDCWPRVDEFAIVQTPICCDYRVAVRSQERLAPTYRRNYATWRDRWRSLQNVAPSPIATAFDSADCANLQALALKLIAQKHIAGLTVTQPTRLPDVFRLILQTAMPLALWVRQNSSELDQPQCDQALALLLDGCASKLSERVQQQRIESLEQDTNAHIGHYLALLWEDPYRLPPSLDYSML